jgi:hypothetical protein
VLPFFATTVRIDVREPFHTPLHVHQALARAFDLGHHAVESDARGITLRKDLFGSLEDGLFSGNLPSLIRIEKSGKRGLSVHFGSPHRAVLDLAFAGLFLAGALGAFASGSTTLAGCLALALVSGLAPALWLEARARRRFLMGLTLATAAQESEGRRAA